MLWRKESDADGTVYTDLLRRTRVRLGNFPLNRKKDNEKSLHARTEGNQKYVENDFNGALELYNKSICFAEKGSEHLSLAYANRSSCFLRLKLYDRCLVDIELAKTANYPKRLMSKLDDRERVCLKKNSAAVTYYEPTLSFEPHERYPCMANVLEIQRNNQYGRLIRATSDIEIGDTILIEDAYIQLLHGTEWNRCSHCIKEKMNFTPCDNCADTMYCSEACSNNNFHEIECDMTMGAEDRYGGQSLMLIIRSLIIAINAFPTVTKLIEFVEKCRESDSLDIMEQLPETPISQYRRFFKLAMIDDNDLVDALLGAAYLIYHAIMGSKLAERFQTTASQRFLMHLTIHHAIILRVNAFGGCTAQGTGKFGRSVDHTGKQQQQDVHLFSSYFNHSCIPNVTQLVKDSFAICKALRPIKEGDQLFIAYVGDDTYDMTAQERNDQLEITYGFRCNCEYCRSADKHKEIMQLQMDADFRHVAINVEPFIKKPNFNLLRKIKLHCIAFLEKYPPRIVVSTREGAFVTTTLSSLMQKEIEIP